MLPYVMSTQKDVRKENTAKEPNVANQSKLAEFPPTVNLEGGYAESVSTYQVHRSWHS